MKRLLSCLHVLPALLVAGCAAPSEPIASATSALLSGSGVPIADFNGDGFADLAVGVPNDDVLTPKLVIGDAGSVHIFYGDGTGLGTSNDQIWTQESDGVPGEAGVGDHFGAAVAVGDFNGDKVSDLAIGAPEDAVTHLGEVVSSAGTVTILYGQVGVGLTSTNSVQLTINSASRIPRLDDGFGSVLATGDVDGDGLDDLAVGVPLQNTLTVTEGEVKDGGAVAVFTGNRSGGGFFTSMLLDENNTDVDYFHPRKVTANDHFGAALAIADFDQNGAADIAVGVPLADEGNDTDCGALIVFYNEVGLTGMHTEVFTQAGWNVWQIPGTQEDDDRFAGALAAGDFDGNGYPDLAIGVPGEDWGGTDAGAVNILYSKSGGISVAGDELFSQAALAVEGSAENNDRFGSSLLAADFNGDGYDELVIGVPGEKLSGEVSAGAVNVLMGRSGGLTALGDQFFSQDSAGIAGKPLFNDVFGSALGRGDFNGDGVADLVIGVPHDEAGVIVGAGTIEILLGRGQEGLSSVGSVSLHRDVANVEGVCVQGDGFGFALGGG